MVASHQADRSEMRTLVHLVVTPILFFAAASIIVGLGLVLLGVERSTPVDAAVLSIELLAVAGGVIYGWRNRWN